MGEDEAQELGFQVASAFLSCLLTLTGLPAQRGLGGK